MLKCPVESELLHPQFLPKVREEWTAQDPAKVRAGIRDILKHHPGIKCVRPFFICVKTDLWENRTRTSGVSMGSPPSWLKEKSWTPNAEIEPSLEPQGVFPVNSTGTDLSWIPSWANSSTQKSPFTPWRWCQAYPVDLPHPLFPPPAFVLADEARWSALLRGAAQPGGRTANVTCKAQPPAFPAPLQQQGRGNHTHSSGGDSSRDQIDNLILHSLI